MRYLLLLVFLLFPFVLSAQEDTLSPFKFGLEVGGFWANDANAIYYNGSGPNGIQRLFSIERNYKELKNKEFEDNDFQLASLPQEMNYETSFIAGLFGSYTISKGSSFFVDLTFLSLESTGAFTILVENPGQIGEDIRKASIAGKEQRFQGNIGFHQDLSEGKIFPFVEIGGTITGIKPTSNRVVIGNSSYEILHYKNTYRQKDNEGGIGYGGFVQGGVRFNLNEDFALDAGYWIGYQKLPLLEVPEGTVEQALLLRIIYK